MKTIYWIVACRGQPEGVIHLCKVVELQHQVKLTQMCGCETQLTPGNAIGNQHASRFQFIEIRFGCRNELQVVFARLQVAPDVVDIQVSVTAMLRCLAWYLVPTD